MSDFTCRLAQASLSVHLHICLCSHHWHLPCESHIKAAVLQQVLPVGVQASCFGPSAMPFPDDKVAVLDVLSEKACMKLLSSRTS